MGNKSGGLAFSEAEYAERVRKTQGEMARRGLDAIVVTDPSNQAWLTGYDGWSFYVHQAVVLPADAPPLWWGRRMDSFGALRTVWMPDDRVIAYADRYVQTTDRHPMEDLAALLRKLGHEKSKIGVETDNYYYSAKAHEVLLRDLPDARFVDATALVNWQRVVKSEAEIALIRRAAGITSQTMRLVVERAEAGMRKNELVADIFHSLISGTADSWGDYAAIVPMLPSGPDGCAAHLTWNGDALKAGEGTAFEFAGCHRRYHAPLARSVHFGKPPQRMTDAAKALNDGLAAGIDIARPGARACDIAGALEAEMAKVGIDRAARCGYPIGLSYPPDWGERTFSLRASDETELQANMTLHFMPGVWMDDWGVSTTETILIREDGPAEPLCDVERKLFVKD